MYSHSCYWCYLSVSHDDVIKWKHFPRYWPFVWGRHRLPVNSPHKSRWRGALMFSLIFAWINDWVNNGEATDLRRHRTHYDVNVMLMSKKEWDMIDFLRLGLTFLWHNDLFWIQNIGHRGIKYISRITASALWLSVYIGTHKWHTVVVVVGRGGAFLLSHKLIS